VTVRLFLAIDAPEPMGRWAAGTRERLARWDRRVAAGLKWVEAAGVHLTVRFLGEVSDPAAAALRAALRAPLEVGGFDLQFSAVAWLPPRGRPRVLVVDLAKGEAAIAAVRRALDLRIDPVVGPDPETRPLHPHLTLARVRDRDAAAVYAMAREVPAACGPVPDTVALVEHVTLYMSELSPRGPRYTVLERVPLGRPDAGPHA
jgi:2'-5' RNA ligase